MGRKLKLAQLGVLVVLYFFLVNNSGLYSGQDYPAQDTWTDADNTALQRPSGGSDIPGIIYTVESYEEGPVILVASNGQRFYNNTFVTIPETVSISFGVLTSTGIRGANITIVLDGVIMTSIWIKLDIGTHLAEAYLNDSYYIWTIQVLSEEAYKALESPSTEPSGLWLKAAILAGLTAVISLPLGALIKYKRARPVRF